MELMREVNPGILFSKLMYLSSAESWSKESNLWLDMMMPYCRIFW